MLSRLFTHALVRPPSDAYQYCIRIGRKEKIDLLKAKVQHDKFTTALREFLGVNVKSLLPLELPDAVFIEDTAIVLDGKVIATNPGAETRKQEVTTVLDFFEEEGYHITILERGTMDGGDIMKIGGYVIIGISTRTNREAAEELSRIVKWLGLIPVTVNVNPKTIHLKTACSPLDPVTIIAAPQAQLPELKGIRIIQTPEEGLNGANCVAVGGKVVMCTGYPRTREIIEKLGYEVLELDLSEFEKGGGGPTSLCLRYTSPWSEEIK